ncbi:MAG TPA: succinate--CoA ligase subunit alpha, partial [Limnochordales bacterium]
ALARQRDCWIVGPNTAGIIWPGRLLLGSLAPDDAVPGPVALISRSGTLSFEMVRILSQAGFGQSLCVNVGGDRVIGRNPAEYLRVAAADPGTRAIVLVGEVGGTKEYEAAEVVRSLRGQKPVVAYVAGRSVPRGRTMGHVGAILETDRDTAEHKRRALAAAGAVVVDTPWEVPGALRSLLAG